MKTIISLLALLLLNTISYTQTGKIDINNIDATINPSNVMFQTLVPDTNVYFKTLKRTNQTTIFSSAVWITGLRSIDSNLQGSYQSYIFGSNFNNTFSTGPLSCVAGSGTGGKKDFGAATISSTQQTLWNKVFCANKWDIELFVNWYLCTQDPFCDTSISFPGYTIPSSILDWPAHGDLSESQDNNLAPFVDIDSDGSYNPNNGDHPCIKGDQYCWFVINDKGLSLDSRMGIEMHVEVYSFDKDSLNPLSNTLFIGRDIINRSTVTYNEFTVGQFTDFDLGCADDDYIGSMPILNSYYGYNADPIDDNCYGGVTQYGTNPPAQSVTFLNKTMAKSMFYDNSVGVQSAPNNLMEAHNYLNGKWNDGVPLHYGGNGYPAPIGTSISGVVYNHIYPFSTPIGISPWTEFTAGNPAGDRRMLGSIAPTTLAPGDVIELDLAYVFSRSDSGNLKSVDQLYRDIQTVQSFYNDSNSSTCQAFVLSVPEENLIAAKVFPNPSTNYFTIETEGKSLRIDITAIDGKLITSESELNQSARIDAINWSDGLYLLKLYDERGNSKVLRIIKN